MIAWCLFLNSLLQGQSKKLSLSDKQIAETKQIPASKLDAELPKLPFANWFGQTVGREAGVIRLIEKVIGGLTVPMHSCPFSAAEALQLSTFHFQENHEFLNGFQARYQQRGFAVSLSGGI